MCKLTENGQDYQGNISTTISGYKCQDWSLHSHQMNNPVRFPDATLEDAQNFCRNPDGRMRPWCYVQNPKHMWNYCNILDCHDYQATGKL